MSKLQHTYKKIVIPQETQSSSILELLQEGVVDSKEFKLCLVSELLETREKVHLTAAIKSMENVMVHNFITVNKRQFLQTKGIPQGLCLSQILANFYYSSIEDAKLSFLKQHEHESASELNCLMRFTDDYLLMTTDLGNAKKFIQSMFKLARKFEFKVNMGKLRTNFELN